MVGMVAYTTGSRPSDLLEWKDEDEWMGRLLFDSTVMSMIMPKMMPKMR